MRKLIAFSFCIAAFSLSGPSLAGTSVGNVTNMIVHVPNILMFSAGSISNTPTCNTANQWAISLDDPVGKPMLAVLLAAQSQGKQVFVHGYSNTCRDWGDRELPSYVQIID